MKILTATQIREADAYTIEHEPIESIDLMERASRCVADRILSMWGTHTPVKVFAGPGNNGGDALAVARMLSEAGYSVCVYLFNVDDKLSPDCRQNKTRLSQCSNVELVEVSTTFVPPVLSESDLIIDGLFGTGVTRPLNGGFASVVKYINASKATVVSIDMPSGLMCEDNTLNVMYHVVHADYTFTFQYPKLAFFFAENEQYLGLWEVLDIGVTQSPEATATPYQTVDVDYVRPLLKKRSRFAHKGSVGKAALVAGKKGMAGAAMLAAKACLRTGVGKLTVRTPEANVLPLQIGVPEAVLSIENGTSCFAQPFDTSDYDALAIGPGMGTEQVTVHAFIEQVRLAKCPIVVDADALNIIGSHRGWVAQLPNGAVLTPHKKELFGIIGQTRSAYEELRQTIELCKRQSLYVVIKGAYSAICTPAGEVFFNTTGNPGMATAGSGDVLTGIILSLLAQEYPVTYAVLLGVYLHGLAGDIAMERYGEEGLIASDIIEAIPEAFRRLRGTNSIQHDATI